MRQMYQPIDSERIESELCILQEIASSNLEIDPIRREDLIGIFQEMINANSNQDSSLLDSLAAGLGKWLLMDLDLAETPFGEKCVELINRILVGNAQQQ